MKKLISILLAIVIITFFGGCASTGLTASAHLTNVGLTSKTIKLWPQVSVVNPQVKGILGVSFGIGLGGGQFSIIPLSSNRALYKNAMENLWANFAGQRMEVLLDWTLALTNLRYDSETFNMLFYTKIKIVVIADVVEFK
ncbi:MAG: hypothetical protein IPN36_07100 [Bacteroidetes bacterium]|nr:hypothetical protein [Bacteroidota bacterium]